MPITILKRENQYHGQVFDVAKVHLRLPNGRVPAYDLVEHGDSVTILPVDAQGNIYFVRQYRVGAEKPLLELPAGVLDPDEAPLTAAKREIREEIGLGADEMRALGGFYLAPGYTDEFMTVFLATGLYDAPLEPDEDEFLDVQTLPKTTVYRMAYDGEFQDGKTLAALLLAQPSLMP